MAKAALVHAAAMRWDWMVRCSCLGVSEESALVHADNFRRRLRHHSYGIHLIGGLHRDPYLHLHGLLHLSRHLRARFNDVATLTEWLRDQWHRGEVHVEAIRSTPHAIAYLARHPETVSW